MARKGERARNAATSGAPSGPGCAAPPAGASGAAGGATSPRTRCQSADRISAFAQWPNASCSSTRSTPPAAVARPLTRQGLAEARHEEEERRAGAAPR